MMRARTVVLLVLLGLASCHIEEDLTPRFQPALEHVDMTGPEWRSSLPVLLVSDTQIHNIFSLPVPERNLSVEMLADTAIRPPQLDLFAPDVLRWILENGAEGTEAILYVGDALDLACDGELATFLAVMEHAGKPWLLVPGNHECYHFGTYSPLDMTAWKSAAYQAGNPITKDRYVRLYVAAILKQDDPGAVALAGALGLSEERDLDVFELEERIPDEFTFESPRELGGFLLSMHWRIDREQPWRSFVVQRADLTGRGPKGIPATAILLDTSQYSRLPILVPNAWDNYDRPLNCGATGEMMPDQLRIVRRWVEEAQETAPVLVGHHPIENLASKTKSSLYWLWAKSMRGGFITAHTHHGSFRHHGLGHGQDGLELNVGSTTDWPMEWRTLVIHTNDRVAYLESRRFQMVDRLENREGYFLREWEVPVGAPDDYRRYKVGEASGSTIKDFLIFHHLMPPVLGQPEVRISDSAKNTERQVKDTLLWTFHRLVRIFETDLESEVAWPHNCFSDAEVLVRIEEAGGPSVTIEDKIALLVELVAFEDSRSTRDPRTGESSDAERLRYKLSQAVWASRYELTDGRKLRPEDELIRIRQIQRD